MPMWPLTVLLWVPVAAAAAASCQPTIRRLNDTNGGGWTLLLSARLSPSCHCQRLGIRHQPCARLDTPCSTWKVPGLQAVESGSQVTVHLAGWYFARCCEDNLCYSQPEAKVWVDGLNYTTWNVSISAQQIAADPPQLSVELTRQMDPSTDLNFYLPELVVILRNASNKHEVEAGPIGYPEGNSYVFGRNGSLAPGLYRIEVRPRHLHCGSSCKARYLLHRVRAPERPSVDQVSADTAVKRTLYLALGVPVGLALVLLAVLVSCRLMDGRRGRRWLENVHGASHKPPPLAPAGPVSVLLLHRGTGGGLDGLRAALRAAGIVLLDARDPSVLNLMQTYSSPAELLTLETFRDARLLFVGGGDPAGSVLDQVYDSMLRFVRNGRLGLDYGRVYSATLGDVPGDELAGLVEGRLFRLPDDVPTLIEHLLSARRLTVTRLCSAGSRTDLLPAMVQSPGLQTAAV